MSGVFGKHARVREDVDEMMMAMRSYELRATEMGITAALKKCRGPISSMGSGAHCRESGYVLAEWSTDVPSEQTCHPEDAGAQVLPPVGHCYGYTLRQASPFPCHGTAQR